MPIESSAGITEDTGMSTTRTLTATEQATTDRISEAGAHNPFAEGSDDWHNFCGYLENLGELDSLGYAAEYSLKMMIDGAIDNAEAGR